MTQDLGASRASSEPTEATASPAEAPASEQTGAPGRPAEGRPSEPPTVRGSNGLGALFLHLHPRMVRRRSASAVATLGLGLATTVALALVGLSGGLLLFYYVPSVERAHASVQDLVSLVPLGAFLRSLHRWSGHAAVLFAVLHLIRTLLWGAYRGAHRRVWLVGAGLLFCTIATSYSGYLLPWDQDAYWTITVGTSLARYVPLLGSRLQELLLGGETVGQAALTRFFVLHVALLPALGLGLLALHLFRLRRAGGLARPPSSSGQSPEGEELISPRPTLLERELALALALTLALCLVALALPPPLGPAPDMLRPDNPPKAPWFLVGLQETVSYSAVVGGLVFPALLTVLLLCGPWLDGGVDSDGAPLSRRGARLAIPAAAVLCAGIAAGAVLWWGNPQHGAASWLNPATVACLAVLAVTSVAALCWRDRAVTYQASLVGLLSALLVFTVVGWFFRGPDWTLTYHPGPGRETAGESAPRSAPSGEVAP